MLFRSKLDPSNTELLRQKQELLQEAVKGTKERLDALKTASEQAAKTAGNYDAWKKAYEPIQEEIGKTGEKAKQLKEKMAELEKAGKVDTSEYKALGEELKSTESQLKDLKQQAKDVSEEFGNPISHEQYDALQREIIETEQQLKQLQEAAAQSKEVLVKLGEAGGKMEKAGDAISEGGKKMSGMTAAIGGIGLAAVKTAADFDSAMSQVAAVSGASGDDFLALRDKAREMGEKTKFSASEAAEAMNYMAMAGWKTGDMLEGIDGIMNLAAASGENLGTTSDIVTDALTAFGLSAADSGHFADVLAAASSNANTNVSMLGESFKYVAPVAGSLGYSAEDTAVALGIMANAGIKASQAGTSLRSALTNMVSPTDKMYGVMNKFGIEIQNTDGSMKPFLGLMGDLREKFRITTEEERAQNYAMAEQQMVAEGLGDMLSGLSEEQKRLNVARNYGIPILEALSAKEVKQQAKDLLGIEISKQRMITEEEYYQLAEYLGKDVLDGLTEAKQAEAAATLFGKEAMSGMLNIINASDKDFEKLTGAIYNCDGATEEMANTMIDNLNGQFAILMSQLQELAISLGDILMPAVRDVVGWIQGVGDKLNSLDEGTKQSIVKIALIVAAIGPLLIVIGTIISKVGTAMKAFSLFGQNIMKLSANISGAGGVLGKLGAAIGGVSAPVMAVVAVIGTLVAAFVHLWNTNEEFRNTITEIWNGIKQAFTDFGQGITDRLNALGFDFESFTEAVKAIWTEFCNLLAPVIEFAFSAISTIVQVALDAVMGILDFFIALFQGDWEGCWNAVKGIAESAWNGIKDFFSGILDMLKGMADVFLGWFGTSWSEVWGSIKAFFEDIWNGIVSFFTGILDSILNTVETVWETIKNVIQVAIMFIAELFHAAFEILTVPFRFIWENCKEYILEAWEYIKGAVTDGINAVKDVVETVFNAVADFTEPIWDRISNAINVAWEFIKAAVEIAVTAVKEKVTKVFNDVKEKVTSVWNKIKTAIMAPVNEAKTAVSDTLDRIREKVASVFDKVKEKVTNVWNDIKSAITKPITDAKNTVFDLIEKIKEKFNFQWSLPHLKLPHPTISGEFSLSPPSVPSFSIEWYKKAMDSAMVMDTPTIFGYNARTNQLLAGGEAGREVVSGEDHLVSLIGSVVREQYGQLGSQVDRLTSVVQQYFPQVVGQMERDVVLDSGALVGRLAPKMDDRLGIFSRHKERGN